VASIALFAFVQSAAGASIAGSAAASIGLGLGAAFVDAAIIMPRLFPPPDNEGPKFDETNLQSAAEGAPINRCYGGASRMGGQVLWMSDLQKISTLAATSGKGGGYSVSGDQYKVDVAVAFCGNEVAGINRLHADGKQLVTDTPDVSVSDNTIACAPSANYFELSEDPPVDLQEVTVGMLASGGFATIAGYSRKSTFTHTNPAGANVLFFQGGHGASGHPTLGQTITLDANGAFGLAGNVTLNDSFTINHGGSIGVVRYWFKSTVNVSGSAFSVAIASDVTGGGGGLQAAVADNTQVTITAGVNGTYKVLSAGTDLITNVPSARFESFHGQTHAAGATITVEQSGQTFDPSKLSGITVYTGTDYQEADPIIASWLGAANVPAYRGRAYIVLEGLILTDFGNRMPNMTARCTQSNTPTYEDVLTSMLVEAGLDPSLFDVSALTDQAPGYYVQGPLSVAQMLQPLMIAGEYIAQEQDGVLTFYSRTSAPTLEIETDDLGAYPEGASAEYPATVSDADDFDVPSSVTVSFLDPNKDFQSGTVRERAMGVASGQDAQMRLPLALTTARARDLAQHALFNSRTNRQRLTSNIPPSYLPNVRENMLASLTVFDEAWSLLTMRVDVGDNWLIQVEGMREDTPIIAFAESGDAPLGVAVTQTTKTPPALRLQIMDAAPFSDAHADRLGFYVAAGSFQADKWGGGVLYASSDGGESYKYVTTLQKRATMGECTTALADGPLGIFDRANTVTVELDSGELESVTEADCLKGANRMWIKSGARGEVIGFTTATLVDTRTYELSGLLRGLRDTRDYTASHAAGDVAVLLNENVTFYESNAAGVGVQRMFKLVPSGGLVADATAYTERLQGYTMRPFAPARVSGERDGSDNLTVTAVRRSRRLVSIFGSIGSAPADMAASTTYELDIMDGSDVLRTITADSPEWEYTAADQTLDGLTPGDPVTVRAMAVSETVGRGNYLEETV
jgi:hypothetical protein